MDYGKKVFAALKDKMEQTRNALATLWFGKRMDFIRGLVDGAVVTMEEFTGVIQELAGNPILAAASDEEKGLIQGAILEHHQKLHQDGLLRYLLATGSTDLADFFIDSALAIPPAFEEEIRFNDPRCLLIKQAYASVEALCPENIQWFAEVVLFTLPHLPYGKDGNGGGLRGFLEIASERGPKQKPTAETTKPNGGLRANDGNGNIQPVARRDDSPRGPNKQARKDHDGDGKRPTPQFPKQKYAKPGEFSLDDSTLPPPQSDYRASSSSDRTLTRDEDLPSPTKKDKKKKKDGPPAGTMASILLPLKDGLPKGDPATSIN